MECVIPHHGVLEGLLSDCGPTFLSTLVQDVCKAEAAGYHPQCDDLIEKFNSTVINTFSSVDKYGHDRDNISPIHFSRTVWPFRSPPRPLHSTCYMEERLKFPWLMHIHSHARHTTSISPDCCAEFVLTFGRWLIKQELYGAHTPCALQFIESSFIGYVTIRSFV